MPLKDFSVKEIRKLYYTIMVSFLGLVIRSVFEKPERFVQSLIQRKSYKSPLWQKSKLFRDVCFKLAYSFYPKPIQFVVSYLKSTRAIFLYRLDPARKPFHALFHESDFRGKIPGLVTVETEDRIVHRIKRG